MRMKIKTLYSTFMPIINLNNFICPEVIKLYFSIKWARGSNIAQRMKFNLINYSIMLFKLLNNFLCCHIPYIYILLVTRYNISGNWWELDTSNPIIMLFILSLKPSIGSWPYFYSLIITSWDYQVTITRVINTSYFRVMSFCYCDLFSLILHFPEFNSSICRAWRN